VAQGFASASGALRPQFSASAVAAESKQASLVLPQLCTAAVHLADVASGAAVDISLNGALPVAAQTVGGYVVYPSAFGVGGTVLHRALPGGSEDFINFPTRPATPEVDYTVALGTGIAGLRLVSGTLEMLDASGTPRLHVSPPYIVGADGIRTDGALAVGNCAVDSNPSGPWGRAVTAPGASTCTVRVTWPDASVSYPAILDPRWTTTGSMGIARFEHTLLLLSTGKALAAGGRSSTTGTTALTSAELYDPTSGTWSPTGSMTHARRLHSMTQLGTSSNGTTSGKVLVAGGISGTTSTTSADLYSPSAGTWIAAGNLDVARHSHTATLLPDGRVLAAGGLNGTTMVTTAALYNPASGAGSWVSTTGPVPPGGIKNHTATLIQTTNTQLNNHVLLVGGNNGSSTVSSVYLFDPVQNAFSTLASIPSPPRELHTAVTLTNTNGKILVAGGKNGSTVLASAIVFDPSFSNGTWSPAGTMNSPRVGHSMTQLPNSIVANGQLLVAGGSSTGSDTLASAELFSGTSTWTVTPSMPGPLQGQQAVLLSGNMVLVAGGLSATSTVQTASYLYDASFGLGCTTNSQCSSGFCSSGICCNTACTGTCGACNLAGHLGTCTALTSGTVCRASAGSCDVAETCNGTVLTCPSDALAPSTTVCRTAAGECDAAETCTGSSASCPADTKKTSGTACTDDGNPCTQDKCDGTTVTCQHPVGNAGTVCRASAGLCDVAETCTGTSTTCPADGFAPAATVCRATAGECDVAETCTGTSASCPSDGKKSSGTACTADTNPCTKDQCDGSSALCQHPAGNPGTVCRASAGLCDVAETCTGSSTTCPIDSFASPSTVCRASAGLCDVAETCTGSSATCPIDSFASPSTVCRATNGECDVAETCTGSSSSCPTDGKKAAGTACTADNNVCTKDQCDGSNVLCQHPAGNAGTVCRASAGLCDVAEACTGTSTACPDDGFASASTVCRPANGQCDVADSCTGTSSSCPIDGKSADGSLCNDGNPCTHDACQAGVCVSSSPVTCTAADECHTSGFCSLVAGGCSGQMAKPDGSPCTAGACIAAACLPLSASNAIPTTIDPTVPVDFQKTTAFLYSGAGGPQGGGTPNAIVRQRAGVIRGRVFDTAGDPMEGATAVVAQHPEYGVTVSGTDGTYDLAVNAGELLEVEIQALGHLAVRRTIFARELQYTSMPDVTLTALDSAHTEIRLSSTTVQTATASQVFDASGIRQSVLMFFPGTQAALQAPDGTSTPLDTLTIRATEYTVGSSGPRAMPATLPPTTGYTYAAELSADEALNSDAKSVTFSQPVVNYVDNFLQFPAGTPVPAAYYDPLKHGWIPSANGVVLQVLTTSGGIASIDANGDGVADPSDALAALGISQSELVTLAELYSPGQSLWRVPVTHFSTWDYNWPFSPPLDAVAPPDFQPSPVAQTEVNPCKQTDPDPSTQAGPTLDCNDQVLADDVPVVGTPLTLTYSSSRVPGYSGGAVTDVPVSGATVPPDLLRIDVSMNVAGQITQQSFSPIANQTTRLAWNGRDAFSRAVLGATPAIVTAAFVYAGVYDAPRSDLVNAFGGGTEFPGVPITGDRTRQEVSLPRSAAVLLRNPDAIASEGLGGWFLNVHHTYNPYGRTLSKGDGTEVVATAGGTTHLADNALLGQDALLAPDGNLYIANALAFGVGANLVKVTSPSTFQIVAAGVQPEFLALRQKTLLFLHPVFRPGSQSFTGSEQVEQLNPDGSVQVIAGSSDQSCYTPSVHNTGDEGPATEACIGFSTTIRVAPDGDIYLVALESGGGSQAVLRRIDAAGIIHRAVPTAVTDAYKILDLAFAVDGSSYLVVQPTGEFSGKHILVAQLMSDGTLRTIAGTPSGTPLCSDDDNSNGVRASACGFGSLNIRPDGSMYGLQQIKTIPPNTGSPARLVRILPSGQFEEMLTGRMAGVFGLSQLHLTPTGDFLVADTNGCELISGSLPSTNSNGYLVPSSDGSELYSFDTAGRHLETRDALTNAPKWTFGYDPEGHVASIGDRNGLVTTVLRDATGAPSGIVSPTGQQTTLSIGPDGYLASITSPGGAGYAFEYSTGLLTKKTDPRGGIHQFTYDSDGKLIRGLNPAGGGWNISPQEQRDPSRSAVTVTSGEGRAHLYQAENTAGAQMTLGPLLQGNRTRTTVGPDGLTRSIVTDSQGDATSVSPDGTVVQTTMASDPRFGMAAPYVAGQTVTTPSGLTYASTTVRTASLAGDGVTLTSQTDSTTVNGHTSNIVYNGGSRTTTTTSPAGRQSVITQDQDGRTVFSQVGALAPRAYAYDPRGRLASVTDGTGPSARVTSFSYDDLDRPTTWTDPLFLTSSFGYDTDGRVTSQTTPGGAQTVSTYDPAGDLVSVTPPGETAHQFTYTFAGDGASYTAPTVDGIASTTSYLYNRDRQPTLITRPDGKTVSFTYDSAGRPSTTTYDAGTVTRIYSPTTGRLANVAATDGGTLDFSYDGNLLLSTTWSGTVEGSVSRTWNNDFRIATESVNGGNTVAFTYDADGLITAAGALAVTRDAETGLIAGTTLGGVSDARTYNMFGERTGYVASYNGTPIFQTQDTLDNIGRLSERTETVAGVSHVYDYVYDPAGRLSSVTTDGLVTAAYTYDGNGNRLSKTTPNGAEFGSYDAQDRLVSYGKYAYTYTPNGELATKTATTTGHVTSYTYDAIGNLRSVALPDGRLIEYIVDGTNRRIGKRINGALTQGWIFRNSLKPVAETDGTGTLTARFVYGTTGAVPAYFTRNGSTYRVITDGTGSPRVIVDAGTGAVVDVVGRDDFGVVINESSPGFQTFGFGTGQYDVDTGLVRIGARDLDPIVGRWITRDPAGFLASTNVYSYAANDPVNHIDPTGLIPQDKWYGFNDRDFKNWVHRQMKDEGDPNFSKKELAQLYEDWKNLGKPGGDKRNKPQRGNKCDDPSDQMSDPDSQLDPDSDPDPENGPQNSPLHKFEGPGPWWETGEPVNPLPVVPGVISPMLPTIPPFTLPSFGPVFVPAPL
jgi:RHS repeat-associated protein